MHDDLRWNKLFGAVLATGLAILLLRQGSEMFFAAGKFPAHPGDAITIQEAAGGSTEEAADTPPDWGTVLPTADVAAGQTISTKCQSCHNLQQGGPNETGPNLWGVIGRPPASHPGFAYSSAMQDFGKKTPVWDYDHIYMFLAGPQNYINGTKMSFVGLKKREDRINLIAWLRQQSSSPVAIPAPNPKAAAAAKAPAGAAGSAPAPNSATTVAAQPAGAKTPTAVAGPAPVNAETSSPSGVTPEAGAAAAPTRMTSTNPGGPPLAGTVLGGSKAAATGSGPRR